MSASTSRPFLRTTITDRARGQELVVDSKCNISCCHDEDNSVTASKRTGRGSSLSSWKSSILSRHHAGSRQSDRSCSCSTGKHPPTYCNCSNGDRCNCCCCCPGAACCRLCDCDQDKQNVLHVGGYNENMTSTNNAVANIYHHHHAHEPRGRHDHDPRQKKLPVIEEHHHHHYYSPQQPQQHLVGYLPQQQVPAHVQMPQAMGYPPMQTVTLPAVPARGIMMGVAPYTAPSPQLAIPIVQKLTR